MVNSKNYLMPSGMLNATAIAKDLLPIEPMPQGALLCYDRDISPEDDLDSTSIGLYACHYICRSIGEANFATEAEIEREIVSLQKLMGTGYYDGEGDALMQAMISYLQSKLEKETDDR